MPRLTVRRSAVLLLWLLGACGEGQDRIIPSVTSAAAQTPSTSAFQEATNRVLPSVVYVEVQGRPPIQRDFLMPFRRQPEGPLQPLGSGSGVVFRAGGYILTNNHVVQRAERVTISTYDGHTFQAQVIARDPSTDIAVVRVESELPVAELGNSDSLELGQWVLAAGSPLGLRFTVTAGIISATGRALGILGGVSPEQSPGEQGEQAAPIENFIQTDAAINPGNSGGPLVDLNGRVIGINSAIASPTGVFAGYGFAVPINLARDVARQLIERGEVHRPYLGVALDAVDPVDVRVYRLSSTAGAEVVHVDPKGPTASVLELGDVIVAVAGQPVRTVAEFQAALARLSPNATVPVRVIRGARERELQVKLGLVRSGVRPERTSAGEDAVSAGLQVVQRGTRVIIAGVQPYSAAARAGLRPGYVIVSANGEEIRSVDQLRGVAGRAQGVMSLIVEAGEVGRLIVNFEL